MFFSAIAAGLMISIGCIVYLTVGGVVGACLFAVGLLAVLGFGMNLFTGKAGLLSRREITWGQLGIVWLGNFVGCIITAGVIAVTEKGQRIAVLAQEISQARNGTSPLELFIYGAFTGILMYSAVELWKRCSNPFYAMIPVAVFILAGFAHCVADMFYLVLGSESFTMLWPLIPTSIGNLIGCNIIGLLLEP